MKEMRWKLYEGVHVRRTKSFTLQNYSLTISYCHIWKKFASVLT